MCEFKGTTFSDSDLGSGGPGGIRHYLDEFLGFGKLCGGRDFDPNLLVQVGRL